MFRMKRKVAEVRWVLGAKRCLLGNKPGNVQSCFASCLVRCSYYMAGVDVFISVWSEEMCRSRLKMYAIVKNECL